MVLFFVPVTLNKQSPTSCFLFLIQFVYGFLAVCPNLRSRWTVSSSRVLHLEQWWARLGGDNMDWRIFYRHFPFSKISYPNIPVSKELPWALPGSAKCLELAALLGLCDPDSSAASNTSLLWTVSPWRSQKWLSAILLSHLFTRALLPFLLYPPRGPFPPLLTPEPPRLIELQLISYLQND